MENSDFLVPGLISASALFLVVALALVIQHAKSKSQDNSQQTLDKQKNERSIDEDSQEQQFDDVTTIEPIYVPRLLKDPIRKEGELAFDLVKDKFPESIQIIPMRFFYPLNAETKMLLAFCSEITEPVISGHPQTVYNTFCYPIKVALQNPAIINFWFETVQQNVSNPIQLWKNSTYLQQNFKKGSRPQDATHIVPLYIVQEKELFENPFHVRGMLIKHFATSTRCINHLESDITPPPSSKVTPPVILLFCLNIADIRE
ncbi:MAG: hypothetical protein EZS28_028634 [Streblomastix strix]|uniref:Uncharacterized protein n=1 Tax=Streblomastix strix TaxID=222440 RepID=A0A5J4UZH7_9EUKA|nr:MAG: hypothetical protein EZS28_028634 [Streblomastix strix]